MGDQLPHLALALLGIDGFGAAGEGYVRLSAFNSRANVEEAMARVRALAPA